MVLIEKQQKFYDVIQLEIGTYMYILNWGSSDHFNLV